MLVVPILLVTGMLIGVQMLLSFSDSAAAEGFVAVQSGSWHDPNIWGGAAPPVFISDADTVEIPSAITVSLYQGPVENSGQIIINGSLDLTYYSLTNDGSGVVDNNGVITIYSSQFANLGTLHNSGSFSVDYGGNLFNSGLVHNTGFLGTGEGTGSGSSNVGTIINDNKLYFARSGNHGTIINNDDMVIGSLAAANFGILNNTGILLIDAVFGLWNSGTINNLDHGVIQVNSLIDNQGIIFNSCNAQIINQSQISGNEIHQESCGIESIMKEIDNLHEKGKINAGEVNSLKKKLVNAENAIQGGRFNPACNQINAFINEISAMAKSKRLSAVDAHELIELTQEFKKSIDCV